MRQNFNKPHNHVYKVISKKLIIMKQVVLFKPSV